MIYRISDQKTIAERIGWATSFTQRLQGLMFTKAFPQAYDGFMLTPCNSVHTLFMRYAIDVVFLDLLLVTVAIRANMQPWRISNIVKGATYALELPQGSSELFQIRLGDHLAMSNGSMTKI
ncbi:MAG: DUF192 domain-containing protein [Firmicutes bacterium]|nr:DUF192 domain-containing protein [Bacillota bacterium]